ncbi:MAG: hypothetical protein A2041_09865 [Bacteroidetes bacterium GWA2_31_9b]|nr:MAG: hypothetical protein A2041_09865 [Bacteroidetes bacterium GWA2_31_9b]
MKSVIIILLLTIFSHLGFSQNSEERKIEPFDKIDVFGNIKVEMKAGQNNLLQIKSENIPLIELKSNVKNGELDIKISSNLFKDEFIYITIFYTDLKEISANGSAEIKFSDTLKCEKLTITSTSGARVILKAEIDTLFLNAYQGAQIDISGKSKSIDSFVNNGGVLSATDLICDDAKIKMNTKGKAEITVNKKLYATINTGASLSYFGKPEFEEIKTSLGGKVSKWDE